MEALNEKMVGTNSLVLLVSLNNLKLTSAIAQSEARFSEIEAEIA